MSAITEEQAGQFFSMFSDLAFPDVTSEPETMEEGLLSKREAFRILSTVFEAADPDEAIAPLVEGAVGPEAKCEDACVKSTDKFSEEREDEETGKIYRRYLYITHFCDNSFSIVLSGWICVN